MFLHTGFIYEAYDKCLQRNVALKIEKKDKNKNILMFEYSVLGCLKGKYELILESKILSKSTSKRYCSLNIIHRRLNYMKDSNFNDEH